MIRTFKRALVAAKPRKAFAAGVGPINPRVSSLFSFTEATSNDGGAAGWPKKQHEARTTIMMRVNACSMQAIRSTVCDHDAHDVFVTERFSRECSLRGIPIRASLSASSGGRTATWRRRRGSADILKRATARLEYPARRRLADGTDRRGDFRIRPRRGRGNGVPRQAGRGAVGGDEGN